MNKIVNTITHITFNEQGNPIAVVGQCKAKDFQHKGFYPIEKHLKAVVGNNGRRQHE